MSNSDSLNSSSTSRAVTSNSLRLGIFAFLTVGLVALTWLATKDRIQEQIRASEQRALYEVLPQEMFDNSLIDTTVYLPDTTLLGPIEDPRGWIAFKEGQPSAVILPVVAPDGYNGRIQLLAGIDYQGKLTGVRAIVHKETPGLGDGIETRVSGWILGFSGKSLTIPDATGWAVKKDGGDFDQFTGATITPRAVVNAVYRVLKYYDLYKTDLFTRGKLTLEPADIEENANGQHD
ncbi:electron transport complex subunit RsxG [Sansalvadorimonas sp. 2012CJ34-2]|uniref:Ion-translocating oxidoreductase complex subunit G n=1 Tax=Parendozoicomonas callyspongiae TaxID=2942213 RepID=A0ABT0PHY9_9GAMM|nr:electron transport complex subunit RsxG [Sansalvadorimonas sp. 2012CJ34-2]MCL6270975.1 electron transport complex subunit RsxG [Sansalvadorimonas sp. 2012CJ34-2]